MASLALVHVWCERNFSEKSHLKRHQLSVHLKTKHACDKCEKTFHNKDSLRNHVRFVHEGKGYICDKCDKRFSTNMELKNHIQKIHIEEKLKCLLCEKVFVDKESLDMHNSNEHGMKRFPCSQCGKTLKDKNALRKHQGLHTRKELGLRFSCGECKRSFTWKYNFHVHLKSFHNGKDIEPRMVVDESASKVGNLISRQDKCSDQEVELKTLTNISSKVKKGKWIVRLERLEIG